MKISLIHLRWIPSGISRNQGPDTERLVSTGNYSRTFTCQVSRSYTSHCCQWHLHWLFPFNLSWHTDAWGTRSSVSFIISLQTVLPSSLTGSYRETVALQSNSRTVLCTRKVTEMTEHRNNTIMASPGWLVGEGTGSAALEKAGCLMFPRKASSEPIMGWGDGSEVGNV